MKNIIIAVLTILIVACSTTTEKKEQEVLKVPISYFIEDPCQKPRTLMGEIDGTLFMIQDEQPETTYENFIERFKQAFIGYFEENQAELLRELTTLEPSSNVVLVPKFFDLSEHGEVNCKKYF